MRKTILAILGAALLATLAAFPASAAAPLNPKVVIIVGPAGSSTSSYRADADAAAAEARKFTTNVVRIYTPNATWTAAKAALQGASIVIYMGHGNGFPSPHRSSPWPYSQNGLGLNPKAGGDNSTTQYYGEYYLTRDIRLAPNAVVLLHHLCYASGNSEPGYPEPSLSVARQRVDNFAAGWLRTGARAIIADAHYGAAYYVRALFTTHQTIDQVWRGSPNANDNVISFPSSRTPGYTAEMDPELPTRGFYRSLVGRLTLATDEVTGARYARTDGHPGLFQVPGAAEVVTDGAGLFADAASAADPGATPASTLASGTRLRLVAASGSLPGGAPIYEIRTLDDSQSGFVRSPDLAPRDSNAPQIWGIETGSGAFSPNGDGSADSISVTARISESASWRVRFLSEDGTPLATRTGEGEQVDASWDGLVDGAPVPDGTYEFNVSAVDGWGNAPGSVGGSVVVDTVAPSATGAGASPTTFSPNGDRAFDTTRFSWRTDEAGSVSVVVRDSDGTIRTSFTLSASAGAGATSWDGRSNGGSIVPDGRYVVSVTPRDRAGNAGAAVTAPIDVFTALRLVNAAPNTFYPQDRDRYGATSRLGFSLSRPSQITWTITNAAGSVVFTKYADRDLGAGSYGFYWDGRDQAGAFVPRGLYYSTVRATDGSLTVTTRASVQAAAFRITASDTTPARGQLLTVTAVTAESLQAAPTLIVSQPGVSAYRYRMSRVGSGTYRVTIRLRTGGTGTLWLRVNGTDAGGHTNWHRMGLPLH